MKHNADRKHCRIGNKNLTSLHNAFLTVSQLSFRMVITRWHPSRSPDHLLGRSSSFSPSSSLDRKNPSCELRACKAWPMFQSKNPGPTIPTLHRSCMGYTGGKRQVLSECSPVRYYTVCWDIRISMSLLTLPLRSTITGIIVILFYQCMNALLNPANRRGGAIVWGLVVHTVAMFSFVTVDVCMNLDIQSISSIDNREYPGTKPGVSGPYVYQLVPLLTAPINTVPEIMAYFNMWLAGGLLVSSV